MSDWRDIEPEPCYNCGAAPMTGYHPPEDFIRNVPKKARCQTSGCPFGQLILDLPRWNQLMKKARTGPPRFVERTATNQAVYDSSGEKVTDEATVSTVSFEVKYEDDPR